MVLPFATLALRLEVAGLSSLSIPCSGDPAGAADLGRALALTVILLPFSTAGPIRLALLISDRSWASVRLLAHAPPPLPPGHFLPHSPDRTTLS